MPRAALSDNRSTTWMLVVEGARANLLELDPASSVEVKTRAFSMADPGLIRELEAARVAKTFARLVIVATRRTLDELALRMSSDLRSTVSMQCARGELELPADEVEVRFRRLRSALAFVA